MWQWPRRTSHIHQAVLQVFTHQLMTHYYLLQLPWIDAFLQNAQKYKIYDKKFSMHSTPYSFVSVLVVRKNATRSTHRVMTISTLSHGIVDNTYGLGGVSYGYQEVCHRVGGWGCLWAGLAMADGSPRYPAECWATLREATSSRRGAKLTLQLSVFVPPASTSNGVATPSLLLNNNHPAPQASLLVPSFTCSGRKHLPYVLRR